MLSEIIVLDGGTFFYTESSGDVDAENAEGLFYQDVRHLSRWQLLVDGEPLKVLTGRRVDYCSARMVGVPASSGPVPAVSVRRDRFVSEDAHEDIVLENASQEVVEISVELTFESDFADVMEAPQGTNGEGRFRVERRPRSITLWHERDSYLRATAITFSRLPKLADDRALFRTRLRPGQTWSLCVDLIPIVDGRRRPRCPPRTPPTTRSTTITGRSGPTTRRSSPRAFGATASAPRPAVCAWRSSTPPKPSPTSCPRSSRASPATRPTCRSSTRGP
jgi:hypothetical protein